MRQLTIFRGSCVQQILSGSLLISTTCAYICLFSEFRETGMSTKLNFNSAADLRANYPHFFWQMVRPYLVDALRHLRVRKRANNGLLTSTQTCF